MRRLSVIIPNYNYGRFISDAIRSALAQEGPEIEVIVVDDGSEDDSRQHIEEFGDAVTAIFQPNAGAREAANSGFAVATGDAVIILDSDDMLEPGAAREIAAAWRPGVSKVQYPMRRVDARNVEIAPPFPHFRYVPEPSEIRRWAETTGAYPTAPGSGNAYSREFLERLMPLDLSAGRYSDSALLATAPFFGDVVTVLQPLARYRLHGGNDSNLTADPVKFTEQLRAAYDRFHYARVACGDTSPDIAPLFRGRHLLQVRVAAARLRPDDRPIPGDSRARMVRDALLSPFAPGPEGVVYRLASMAWSLLVLAAPAPIARSMVARRFQQGGRGIGRRRVR